MHYAALNLIKYTVHNHIGLYLCNPDSVCAFRTLSVIAADSICEQTWTSQLKEQKKNDGKGAKMRGSMATTEILQILIFTLAVYSQRCSVPVAIENIPYYWWQNYIFAENKQIVCFRFVGRESCLCCMWKNINLDSCTCKRMSNTTFYLIKP